MMIDEVKQDEYGEVYNGQETYEGVARKLLAGSSVLIGWTDEQSSHFDILFTYGNIEHQFGGQIQGGINRKDLFVSIMRIGAFAFAVGNTDTEWNYYDEKLSGNRLGETTGRKLAELINGIKKELLK